MPSSTAKSTFPRNQLVPQVLIPPRADLNTFKSECSPDFWIGFLKPKSARKPTHKAPPPKKVRASSGSPASKKKACKLSPSKRRASAPVPRKRSKSKKATRHTLSESSNNSDDDDDLELSDFEAPESKLRDRTKADRLRKLRRARKVTDQARAKKKQLLSRRIVPDSDTEGKEESSEEDEDEESSSGEESSSASATDQDEIARLEEEFIVDDLANKRKAARIKRELAEQMPAQFTFTSHDNFAHFQLVCKYMVYHIFLPRVTWWKRSDQYQKSFKRVDSVITSKKSLIHSAAWTPAFKRTLERRRFLTKAPLAARFVGCDACNNRAKQSTHLVVLRGEKYNRETLEELSSDSSSEDGYKSDGPPNFRSSDQPNEFRFRCGTECANKASEYHYCQHWHRYLSQDLSAEIKLLDKKFRPPDVSGKRLTREEMQSLKKQADQVIDILHGKEKLQHLYNRMMARVEKVAQEYATG